MSRKSKETTTSSRTMTPTLPSFVQQPAEAALGRTAQIGAMDPYELIAGFNPLHMMAASGVANLGLSPSDPRRFGQALPEGVAPPPNLWQQAESAYADIGSMLGGSAPQATFTSGLEFLDDWFNPYEERVVDSVLGEFDRKAGIDRAARTLRLAGPQAFSGSGASIAASLADEASEANRGKLDAGIRHQGWTDAAGRALTDSSQKNQVEIANAQIAQAFAGLQGQLALGRASGITSLAGAFGNNERADLALTGDVAEMLRGIEQSILGAPITLNQYELSAINSLAPIFRGEQHNGTETRTSSVSDPMGTIGSLAMIAAAPFTGGATLGGTLFSGLAGLGKGAAAAGAAGGWGGIPAGMFTSPW